MQCAAPSTTRSQRRVRWPAAAAHALVNSLNPYRIEGQKTAAFEILDELGAAREVLALPYGGGGNTCAYAKGFVEADAGLPCILAAQSSSAPSTVASAIRIATPVHEEQVTEALARTQGRVVSVSDDAILEAWRQLAHEEGLATASAASLAALAGSGLAPGTRVVCVITAMG